MLPEMESFLQLTKKFKKNKSNSDSFESCTPFEKTLPLSMDIPGRANIPVAWRMHDNNVIRWNSSPQQRGIES